MAARADLSQRVQTALVASFAFGTVAMTYSRVSNNHILMLAVFAGLFLVLTRSAESGWEKFSKGQLVAIGTLLGLGYSIDQGVGPVLVICSVLFLSYRTRSVTGVLIVLALAFPWFVLHHTLNYMIGGTFLPANTVTQYFLYPGTAFTAQDLTGVGWAHQNMVDFLVYGFGLLGGDQGFIVHNLVLFLAIPAAVVGLRDTKPRRGLVCFSIGLCLGSWLLYAATSNNYAGDCCSIRWFVPLLVPAYYALILALKRYPAAEMDLMILAGWSIVLGFLLWMHQPWSKPMLPNLWYVNLAALFSWAGYRFFKFLPQHRRQLHSP